MSVTLSGMVTEANPVRPENVYAGMVCTSFPNVTVVRLEQPEKIGLEFDPAELHLVAFQMTEVRPEHSLNAPSPMLVTLSGMVIEVSPEQRENAYLPMLVTLLPMVTEVSAEQLENAHSPMLVTPLPMVTEVSPEQ